MAKTLRNLIRASGYAGTTGQSFRNHVSGSASGAKMSDYKITTLVVNSSSVSPPPFTYPISQSFTLPITLPNKGSRSSAIQQLGSTQFGANRFPINGNLGGSSVSVTGIGAWTNGNSTGSMTIKVVAPFAGSPTLTPVTSFNTAGAGSSTSTTPQRIKWEASLTSTPTGTSSLEITTRYAPDSGPFNDTLFSDGSGPNGGFSVSLTNRAYDVSDYQYEWHSNSSYTNVLASTAIYIPAFNATIYTGSSYTPPYDDASYGGSFLTAYLRWRLDTGSGWNNVGAVTWTDTRSPAVH